MEEETKELVEKNIENLYNSLMENPLKILDIFNNFFGEDKVDMQGYPSLTEFKRYIYSIPIGDCFLCPKKYDKHRELWESYENTTINNLPKSIIENIVFEKEKAPSLWQNKDRIFGNLSIIIHFPKVRITNEHDRFVDINHLWARLYILCDGTLKDRFYLNRSEYTLLHIKSNYMHSHIGSIPTNDFSHFMPPCTGSGPINSTIISLKHHYDEALWNLFCLELSKYVTVESIAGTPYHRLEDLGINTDDLGIYRFTPYLSPKIGATALPLDTLKKFIKHFVSLKKLKFNFVNNSYSIGMPFTEFIILISDEFIKWYNEQYNANKVGFNFEELLNRGILCKAIIANNKIYVNKNFNKIVEYHNFIGKKVCTFKGKEITINISDVNSIEDRNRSTILNKEDSLYILTSILKVLNYKYGKKQAINEGASTGSKIRYL